MESIYYVMAWACHRSCKHCYEDRFRPYVRGALDAVVREAERNFPRIVDHFPARMTYLDLDDPRPDGAFPEKTGRVILSGGESLLDAVRERVTYPVIERLPRRYAGAGRREDRRADDRRPPHRRDRRRPARARRLDDLGGERRRLPRRPRGPRRSRSAFVDRLSDAVRAPRHARVGPVGDDAQLARGSRPAVQLLRRHAGLVDRQAVAARPRVAERPVESDARRQLLQPLVGRPQLPAPRATTAPRSRSSPTAASIPAASRPKLPIGNLLEDDADRDPRFARRRAGLRGDHDGPSRAHGPRARLERGDVHRSARATVTPDGEPYQQPVHRLRPLPRGRCSVRCSRRRARAAAPRAASRRAARRAASISIVERANAEPMPTPLPISPLLALLVLARCAAPRAGAPAGATCSRRRAARRCTGTPGPATRRPTPSSPGSARRSRQRYGVKRRSTCKLKDTAEAVTRVVAEKAAGRDARRQRRPDLDQRPELPRDEGAGPAVRPVRRARCRTGATSTP